MPGCQSRLVTDIPESVLKTYLRRLGPIALVLLALAVAWWLTRPGPAVTLDAAEAVAAPVDVMRLEPVDFPLSIETHGIVVPARTHTLVAEVDGTITELSPALKVGTIVPAETVLVRLDPRERAIALIEARANLAEAEARLQEESAEASQARAEWQDLGRGEASPLTLREPQLAAARAARAAANAGVVRAELDLRRTVIRAPATIRVESVAVDAGSFVGRGSLLATLHALEAIEVSLPVTQRAFATLGFDASTFDQKRVAKSDVDGDSAPRVSAAGTTRVVSFGATDAPAASGEAESEHAVSSASRSGDDVVPGLVHLSSDGAAPWRGTVVRVAGIDADSQQVTLVARVDRRDNETLPRAGRFVTASVAGGVARAVFVVPNRALNEFDGVWRVDDEDRLVTVPVRIRWRQGDESIVTGDLAAGDRIVLTRLPLAADGTRVAPTVVDPAPHE